MNQSAVVTGIAAFMITAKLKAYQTSKSLMQIAMTAMVLTTWHALTKSNQSSRALSRAQRLRPNNTMQLKGNEMKKYIPQGLLTIVIDFDDKGDYALLNKVEIGMTESVEYPLTDGSDVLNFCELLEDSIGVPVYANEKHRQAQKLTHFQLSNILWAA